MRIAFLLSGEHPTLPKEEVKAVLEAFRWEYRVVGELESLLILDLASDPPGLYDVLSSRLAFTRSFGRVLTIIEPSRLPEDLGSVKPPTIEGRFRVRAVRIRGCCRQLRSAHVEREIGAWILRDNPGAKVDLDNPSREIIAVMTSGLLVVFLKEGEVDRTLFKIKEVAARPYVHPASMRPTLARAMVNLARTRPGDLVLDPFLGVGGIALEVLSVGARLIGSDIREKMVVEAKNNLMAYGFLEGYTLLVADALDLTLEELAVRIVTDPPYGRMSSPVGHSPRGLVRRFLRRVPDYLEEGGWLAISVPLEFLDGKDFRESGLELVQMFDIREHRSLIRRLWVARLM